MRFGGVRDGFVLFTVLKTFEWERLFYSEGVEDVVCLTVDQYAIRRCAQLLSTFEIMFVHEYVQPPHNYSKSSIEHFWHQSMTRTGGGMVSPGPE